MRPLYLNFNPLSGLPSESVVTSFDNQWDNMPVGRQKFLHGVAAVCKITLDITNSTYTGIFKTGKQTGFMRIGPSRDISNGVGVGLGVAFKFLRTGTTSANLVMLRSLGTQPSYNIFNPELFTLHNHIPIPDSLPGPIQVLLNKFLQATKCPAKMGLSDVAR